jgi:hypothetical protein
LVSTVVVWAGGGVGAHHKRPCAMYSFRRQKKHKNLFIF